MPDFDGREDDWQWDDIDWSEEDAPRRTAEPAAGGRAARQGDGDPASARGADERLFEQPEERLAAVRRRRLAALAVFVVLFGCAVVIPLVVLGGGGGSVVQATTLAPTTPATTARTTTQTQPATTTTTTSTTARSSLHLTLAKGTTLRRGDRGAEVTALQKALVSLGFSAGRPDGSFGATTEAAVIDFQRSNGLTPDGAVGADTVRLLNTALDRKAASG